eukprot:s701_g2.t1
MKWSAVHLLDNVLRFDQGAPETAAAVSFDDDHIPAWASEALASRFEAAKTHAHGGQHFVPQKAADLNVVVDFLKSRHLLKALLGAASAEFSELGPHPPCRSSEDSVQVRLAGGWSDVTLHSGAKAMLLRTAAGTWLHTVLPADCKLSWKKVRALHGKGTRMATEEDLIQQFRC